MPVSLFPPPSLFIPYGEFSPVRLRLRLKPSSPRPPMQPFPAAFDAEPSFPSSISEG